MDPLPLAAALSILLTVFFLLMGLGIKRSHGLDAMAQRLQSLRQPGTEGPVIQKGQEPLLRQRSYSGLPGLSPLLANFRGSQRVALELERAGIPLRVGEYYMIRWLLAFVLFLIPLVVNRGIIGLVFAVILGVMGFMLPQAYVSSKRKGRLAKINAQLVEMLALVSNSLKSGYGLMQSFEFAAQQLRPPLAIELKRMLRETSLGKSGEEALLGLGQRINSPDLDMVLAAINIQRAVGGNLAEVLSNVSFTMRERERIRGEVRTLTSQQRMTGIIIGGLPIGMGALFMLINPDYMGLLFTETVGRIMLLAAVGLEVMGILAMKRILAIDV